LASGRALRFNGAHALLPILLDEHLDVSFNLLAESSVVCRLQKECFELREEDMYAICHELSLIALIW
jgi:hypothetical protein